MHILKVIFAVFLSFLIQIQIYSQGITGSNSSRDSQIHFSAFIRALEHDSDHEIEQNLRNILRDATPRQKRNFFKSMLMWYSDDPSPYRNRIVDISAQNLGSSEETMYMLNELVIGFSRNITIARKSAQLYVARYAQAFGPRAVFEELLDGNRAGQIANAAGTYLLDRMKAERIWIRGRVVQNFPLKDKLAIIENQGGIKAANWWTVNRSEFKAITLEYLLRIVRGYQDGDDIRKDFIEMVHISKNIYEVLKLDKKADLARDAERNFAQILRILMNDKYTEETTQTLISMVETRKQIRSMIEAELQSRYQLELDYLQNPIPITIGRKISNICTRVFAHLNGAMK